VSGLVVYDGGNVSSKAYAGGNGRRPQRRVGGKCKPRVGRWSSCLQCLFNRRRRNAVVWRGHGMVGIAEYGRPGRVRARCVRHA